MSKRGINTAVATTFEEFARLRLAEAEAWARTNAPIALNRTHVLAAEVLVDILLHTGSAELREKIVREVVAGANAGNRRFEDELRLIAQSQEAELGSRRYLVEVMPDDELGSVEDAALDLLAVLFLATAYDAYGSYRYSVAELLDEQARLGNGVAARAYALLDSAFRRAQQIARPSDREPTAGRVTEPARTNSTFTIDGDGPGHERKTMRRIPQWGSELILRPPQEALIETFVMEPEEAASQMFRIQLLYAYVAAVDPNGRIAKDPHRADDPLIRLMLRLADTSVYSDERDELHWIAFFTVLRDESAEDFAHWVTSHRRDFWWRENGMPEIVPWLYEDEDGDVVERFPHLKKAMQELQSTLAAGLKSGTTSRGSPAASSGSSSGGCYIATAVYGSYEAPEVLTLRLFRDERLAPTRAGRAFIRAYYRVSPTLAKHFAPGSAGHRIARAALGRVVRRLNPS